MHSMYSVIVCVQRNFRRYFWHLNCNGSDDSVIESKTPTNIDGNAILFREYDENLQCKKLLKCKQNATAVIRIWMLILPCACK